MSLKKITKEMCNLIVNVDTNRVELHCKLINIVFIRKTNLKTKQVHVHMWRLSLDRTLRRMCAMQNDVVMYVRVHWIRPLPVWSIRTNHRYHRLINHRKKFINFLFIQSLLLLLWRIPSDRYKESSCTTTIKGDKFLYRVCDAGAPS